MQNKGFDKNQLINFVIFSILFVGTMFYFQNSQNEQQKQALKKEKTEKVKVSNVAPVGDAQIVKLANDDLDLEFSSLGGQLTKVELKKYNSYNIKTDKADSPLDLVSKQNTSYSFDFKTEKGEIISTKNLNFIPETKGNEVVFTANYKGATIQFVYTLLPKYKIDFKVKTQGLSQLVNSDKASFVWDYKPRTSEKGHSQEQSHTEFSYAFNNYNDYDYDGRTDMSEEDETLNWIGVKQQFFASVIESKNGFTKSFGHQDAVQDREYLKKFHYEGQVQLVNNELNQEFSWYFIPLEIKLLKSYDKNFDEILPLGWAFIGSMNRAFFIPVYNFLASWGITAGWVIFILTIVVKLILSPITFKQHKLSAMMRVIRPEIEEVNEKFKNADPMKKQQAVMEVYRKAGVNQLAGCLPGLLQIPIFYALFRFFPNFIDLRGQSFWFAKDLTAYDDLIKLPFNVPFIGEHISILALACTSVILIYTIMTSGQMQQPTQEGMPNMKILMYIFPITFFFFLNSAASGLSWYYFVSNTINIIIILVIKYWILDEAKIHKQIQENKAKPQKESKFQKKMREMMEKAQEQQKMYEQQKKKK